MNLAALLIQFLISLALGALIGVEREMVNLERGDERKNEVEFGGIRTYMLISLLGALSSFMATTLQNMAILYVALGGFFLLMAVHYTYQLFHNKDVGLTTEIAGAATFLIGSLVLYGFETLAVMLAIFVTIILVSKSALLRLLEHFERKELYSTLMFSVILFVILPVLPNYTIDPWGVVNPQEVWYVVVLISGISFLGYIASKIVGTRKGIILSGVFGGLASSTAVTSTMSEQSKENPKILFPFIIGTTIASSMMFFRVLFWVGSFHMPLFPQILIPVLAMSISSGILVGFLYITKLRTKKNMPCQEIPLNSPFRIAPALQFAFLFLAISLASHFSVQYFGSSGVYLLSFLSGFADVDAITVTLASQAKEGVLSNQAATYAIILAMCTNTFVKILIAKFFGGKEYGKWIAISFAIILGLGIASLLLL